MKIFTIGFTKKTAQVFFNLLSNNNVDLLIDIRLNNSSQLAGFSKGDDLSYFLKRICSIEYKHDLLFAPTKQILDDYKDKKITWNHYEKEYIKLMNMRNATEHFIDMYGKYERVCFLCSEPTAEKCHRRLIADIVSSEKEDIEIVHL